MAEPSSEVTTNSPDANDNQDELIIQRQREIEKEISESIKLVSDKLDLRFLELEYEGDDVYQAKIKDLLNNYSYYRRTRPDGNCFYRAFGFAFFERLLRNKMECQVVRELVENRRDKLVELGFSRMILEDFHEAFIEAITIVASEHTTVDDLSNLFNDAGFSDYLVVYMRLLTSGELQQNADFYQNFIDGNHTMVEFCHLEVEPMFRESDHIHIIALSTTLMVGTRVRYMDRGESSEAIAHDFPDGFPICMHLLYRPGHYDILYPKSEAKPEVSPE